jgi:hypothetical protein
MHIVDRFPNGLALMNDQSLTTGPIVQCEGSGDNVYGVWKRMQVPWQRGMWCDRHLEGCELWLAGRIVKRPRNRKDAIFQWHLGCQHIPPVFRLVTTIGTFQSVARRARLSGEQRLHPVHVVVDLRQRLASVGFKCRVRAVLDLPAIQSIIRVLIVELTTHIFAVECRSLLAYQNLNQALVRT